MNITIKTLAGKGTSITVQVNPSDNVATLKELVYKSEGIPVDQQILIFCGKKLEDECTFGEYNIQKDSTVHLALKTKDGKFIVIIGKVINVTSLNTLFISTEITTCDFSLSTILMMYPLK